MSPPVPGRQPAAHAWAARPCGPELSGAADAAAGMRVLMEAQVEHAPWLIDSFGLRKVSGSRVLDLGCGPGALIARLAEAGAICTGVDLVEEHVARARAGLDALGLSAAVSVGDAERLVFGSASFDRVVSNNALQFTADLERALAEAFRVLRPGGRLAIAVYHRNSLYYWWWFFFVCGLGRGELWRTRSMARTIGRNIPWAPPRSQLEAHALSRRRLTRLLERSGFASVQADVRGFSWAHLGPIGKWVARAPGSSVAAGAFETRAGWYLVASARRPAG